VLLSSLSYAKSPKPFLEEARDKGTQTMMGKAIYKPIKES